MKRFAILMLGFSLAVCSVTASFAQRTKKEESTKKKQPKTKKRDETKKS